MLKSNLESQPARLTRRSALGMLGVGSAAAGIAGMGLGSVARASAGPDRRGNRDADDPIGGEDGIPDGLRPGGTYDQLLSAQAEQGQFSGNVLLAHRGRPVLARSYGMADAAAGVPNSPETLFALASVAKTLTATAAIQLVQRGQIAFESTLGSLLGGFRSPADTITVHQLLTMTSGMDNYYFDPTWFPNALQQWNTPAALLDGTMDIIRGRSLLFPPGNQYSYSDSGFVVLGAIVQQVSGQDYWDYMGESVFGPAGMTHTEFCTRPQALARLATGEIAHSYSSQQAGAGRVDASGHLIFIGLPDGSGGPYITTADLLAFASALQRSVLLGPAYTRLMRYGKTPLTPRPLDSDPAIQLYFSGYGLEDAVINGQHVLSHSGNGPGIATNLDIYPDLDWIAVVLENFDLDPFGLITAMSPLVELERQLITRGR